MTIEPNPGLEAALGNTKTFSSLLNNSTWTVSAAVSHLQPLNQPGQAWQMFSLSVNTNENDKNIFVWPQTTNVHRAKQNLTGSTFHFLQKPVAVSQVAQTMTNT